MMRCSKDVCSHCVAGQMLALAPDSYSFHYWKTPPVPVQFQLFIFDIVNPEEVMQGAPPSLLERGPYTYRLYTSGWCCCCCLVVVMVVVVVVVVVVCVCVCVCVCTLSEIT